MVEALVGCIAGAVMVEETQRMAEEAGLRDIRLTIKPEYIDSMTRMNDPLYRKVVESLPDGARASDYVVSLEINARKPPRCCCGG